MYNKRKELKDRTFLYFKNHNRVWYMGYCENGHSVIVLNEAVNLAEIINEYWSFQWNKLVYDWFKFRQCRNLWWVLEQHKTS